MKKDIIYVVIQFILFALYFIDYSFIDYVFEIPEWVAVLMIIVVSIGGLIILMGIVNLNENITPFPSPRHESTLISTGIYKYIRHPIYSGIVIVMFAYAIYSGSVGRLFITAVLFMVFYFKSELEEKLLIDRFPKYSFYKKVTGRFFPFRKSNNDS